MIDRIARSGGKIEKSEICPPTFRIHTLSCSDVRANALTLSLRNLSELQYRHRDSADTHAHSFPFFSLRFLVSSRTIYVSDTYDLVCVDCVLYLFGECDWCDFPRVI